MKVYMAGAVWNSDDYGRWRDLIKAHYDVEDIEWVDPVDRLEYDPEKHEPERVVTGDKQEIDECDAMLVGLTTHRTVGTWREVEYVKMMNWLCSCFNRRLSGPPDLVGALNAYGDQKPIVIWTGLASPGAWDEGAALPDDFFSPWVREAAPRYSNMGSCISYLRGEFNDE